MLNLHLKSLLLNSRMLVMLALGFASGLPLALTGNTLQAWYTQAGISVVTIGALSLIGMPYVWKFLWAPLMDRFALPFCGRRRGWILLMQFSLCIAIAVLAQLSPTLEPHTVALMALLIAFLSASQDISVDAYRTDILLPQERGVGTAYFIFAYRIAMLVSGGLALVIADYWGWRILFELMAVLMGFSFLMTYLSPNVADPVQSPKHLKSVITESYRDLFRRESIGLILLFIVFYKLGDALALSLTTTFLLKGVGFTLTEVGLAYKVLSLAGTILGALVGGTFLARLGLFRALLFFGLAQAFSTLLFMLLAVMGKNYHLMIVTIFTESVCSGMGTAAFVAFLMSLCHQRYSATQFACLSALSAVGRVFLGPVAGMLVAHLGWMSFFGWSFLMSFPGILILALIRHKVKNVQLAEC